MKNQPTDNENGNVLFLILIAVALFAALSYAFTKSTRGGEGSADREKTRLIVSNLYNLFSAMDNGLTRLQISQNCTDKEIGLNFTVHTTAGSTILGNSIFADGSFTEQSTAGYTSADNWGYARRADGTCDLFGVYGATIPMTITQTPENHLQMWQKDFIFSAIEFAPYPSQNMTITPDLYFGIWADAGNADESGSLLPICAIINTTEGVINPNSGSSSWGGEGIGDFWGKRTFCVNDAGNLAIFHIVAER